MNARETFEKLDFEYIHYGTSVCYRSKHKNLEGSWLEILFDFNRRVVDTYMCNHDSLTRFRSNIDLGTLQAINKQIEELGWLEGKNNILTAKEMFEEKGYRLKSNRKQYLTYEREYTAVDEFTHKEKEVHELITFDKCNKRVGGSIAGFPKKYWFDGEIIPAINKQQEELGW